MEYLILIPFCFFCLISIGYAFYNKKAIYLNLLSSLMLIILGANILAAGITYTTHDTAAQSWLQQTVGNATVYNTTSSIISAYTDTITIWKDVYTGAIGTFLILFALLTFFLTFFYILRGSIEDKEE